MSFKPCYFCDELGWYPGTCLENYNGFYVCHSCRNCVLRINYSHQENGICGVCFEESTLLTLPCKHRLCLQCCKIIYFGIATTERPIHWREFGLGPDWPFELDDDNNDPERIKYNEYEEFRMQWFNMDNCYEKLIQIRNNLLSIRPDWMNTDEFLNYENEELKYSSQCDRLEKLWDEYECNKFKGNETCPFCKDQPINENHCISCFFYKLEYGTM
jgi:hypothetical protein